LNCQWFRRCGPAHPDYRRNVLAIGLTGVLERLQIRKWTGEDDFALRLSMFFAASFLIVGCYQPFLPGRGATNAGRYSNPKMDGLVNEALRTIDDEKRAELLRQAQTIVLDEHGILPLHFEVTTWAFKPEFAYKARTDQYTLPYEVKSAK
jgi:ABC-type transport system substrate-binding protein